MKYEYGFYHETDFKVNDCYFSLWFNKEKQQYLLNTFFDIDGEIKFKSVEDAWFAATMIQRPIIFKDVDVNDHLIVQNYLTENIIEKSKCILKIKYIQAGNRWYGAIDELTERHHGYTGIHSPLTVYGDYFDSKDLCIEHYVRQALQHCTEKETAQLIEQKLNNMKQLSLF